MSIFGRDLLHPSRPLEKLENCLAGFHYENPLTEPASTDCVRERPNLKVWAKLTVEAFSKSHPDYYPEKAAQQAGERKRYYELVGLIYCHWDHLLRTMLSTNDYEGFGDDEKTQELVEICEILNAFEFSQYILDGANLLPKTSKHAVFPLLLLYHR
jgi:hypothetical protein